MARTLKEAADDLIAKMGAVNAVLRELETEHPTAVVNLTVHDSESVPPSKHLAIYGAVSEAVAVYGPDSD